MAMHSRFARRAFLPVVAALALSAGLAHASTITIINQDGAGEGFNDPTVVAPVGGNPGTTVGQQRLNVFTQAAAIWGGILPSSVVIKCDSKFDPLTCSATSGVLGSTSPNGAYSDFPGAGLPATWYVGALANKLAGSDIDIASDDMTARFNSSVGVGGCLTGLSWYYGYDHNEGASQIDLLAVVLHELAHGLGFLSFVDVNTGAYLSGQSDIFTHFIYDNSQALYWEQMSAAQRSASAINDQNLVFHGTATHMQTPTTLGKRQYVQFSGDPSINGRKQFGTAQFGPALAYPPVSGLCILVNDGTGTTSDGCEGIVNNISGKVAVIDRGTCAFTQKADNAVNAGAIAVIVVNNVAGAPPGMAGSDPDVTVPVVSITQSDGATLKSLLASNVPITATIGTEQTLLAGADNLNWPLLYAPNPVSPGSSVSHWDVSATPNLLMEPAINSDLTSNVDLTRYVFQDIGWFGNPVLSASTPTPLKLELDGGAPNPFRVRTSIRYALPRPGLAEMGVYDVSGRLVRKLMSNWLPAGSGSIVWDATNEAGQRVPAGVYLYRVRVNDQTQTQRIVVSD